MGTAMDMGTATDITDMGTAMDMGTATDTLISMDMGTATDTLISMDMGTTMDMAITITAMIGTGITVIWCHRPLVEWSLVAVQCRLLLGVDTQRVVPELLLRCCSNAMERAIREIVCNVQPSFFAGLSSLNALTSG